MNKPLNHAALHCPSRPAPAGDTDAASVASNPERSPSVLRMDAAAARARHNTAVAVALEDRAAEIEAAWEAEDAGLPSTEDRLRQSRANIAMLDALPPRQVDEEAARKRADDAVRSLLPGLLTDAELVAHSADQRRFKRAVRA